MNKLDNGPKNRPEQQATPVSASIADATVRDAMGVLESQDILARSIVSISKNSAGEVVCSIDSGYDLSKVDSPEIAAIRREAAGVKRELATTRESQEKAKSPEEKERLGRMIKTFEGDVARFETRATIKSAEEVERLRGEALSNVEALGKLTERTKASIAKYREMIQKISTPKK